MVQLVSKCTCCLVQLMGLTEVAVKSSAEIMNYLIEGSQSRTTGATAMNNQSSRSHAIFTIYLQRTSRTDTWVTCFSTCVLTGNFQVCLGYSLVILLRLFRKTSSSSKWQRVFMERMSFLSPTISAVALKEMQSTNPNRNLKPEY